MDTIIAEIIERLRSGEDAVSDLFTHVARKYNRAADGSPQPVSKKQVLPYFYKVREENPALYESWGLDEELSKKLLRVLQVKPRRTSSGVATITVITKPWMCSSDCIFCPNDLRMPKSYLSDEPACQRAERNYFDPYLQVTSRLRALTHMGHVTDKVELIVLGGTWTDYTPDYQRWFITELFRALNDTTTARERKATLRRKAYKDAGFSHDEGELASFVEQQQRAIHEEGIRYNQAFRELYGTSESWQSLDDWQKATQTSLVCEQKINERAKQRVVGLVIETRPDTLNPQSLKLIRALGCTKIQVGIQSINQEILDLNERKISIEKIAESFELMRLFGFKIHVHYMINLYGSNPEEDIKEYQRFVTDERFQPDEVKLYPCVLVESARLKRLYKAGDWQPYSEEELVRVLVADTLNTPSYARISRMIRDISAHDVVAGNKKANLRQLVESEIEKQGEQISEIRYREITSEETEFNNLSLEVVAYNTSATEEQFLQWVTPHNKIAGFLRLSLPKSEYIRRWAGEIPIALEEAIIREVHVYGKVAKLSGASQNAQHIGLGKFLIAEAERIAAESGYSRLKVISAVGTREYYRKLGFSDVGVYQQKVLKD